MADVWVVGDGIGGDGQALKRGVEVCYAILGEETDKVEATDGEFAFRRREE